MPSATEDQYSSDPRHAVRPNLDRWDSVSPKLKSSKYLSTGETEGISPLMLAKSKEVEEFDLDAGPRRRNSLLSRRGNRSYSSSATRSVKIPRSSGLDDSGTLPSRPAADQSKHPHHPHMGALVDELASWLRDEKAKQKTRSARRKVKRKLARGDGLSEAEAKLLSQHKTNRARSSSSSSESSIGLDGLEAILEKRMRSNVDLPISILRPVNGLSFGLRGRTSRSNRHSRLSMSRKLAEPEATEEEIYVPSCDEYLDNSATLGFSGGSSTNVDCQPDTEPWLVFKHEIVRLAHTLKLRGWRQLQMSQSHEINVERLSGALTNAVYVVSPPNVTQPPQDQDEASRQSSTPRRPPLKLLLRIYGPNTGALIDREAELRILRRLCKQNIGPRLLGTFTNGRFEEFLHAMTLKPQDLRVPDTSRQIAKRMRELHDGIELLEEERDAGAFVWQSWDKCVDGAEKTMKFIEGQLQDEGSRRKSSISGKLRREGSVCGTSWAVFRRTVERYRKEIDREYGGSDRLNDQLVFAHNDAQYGNILRLEPPGESPLMLPANVHKQLVVIDFEYANANVPGLEFANHFTEWCYNYHDPATSWACNTAHYPIHEEQIRFLRAYVAHRPQHNPAASATPRFTPINKSVSMSSISIERSSTPNPTDPRASTFSLGPPSLVEPESLKQNEHEKADMEAAADEEVQRTLRETQLWRPANSAQWVVWGILQAHIPGLVREVDKQTDAEAVVTSKGAGTDPVDAGGRAAAEDEQPEEDEEDAEFDYLAYARDRAMFFWGDCLQMGLVTEEELGKDLVARVKVVPY